MSCGISRMYKVSGGTDIKMRKCGECRYLIESEESAGFGGKGCRTTYCCSKYPDKNESHIWSPNYPACKKFRKADAPAYILEDSGQYVLVLA